MELCAAARVLTVVTCMWWRAAEFDIDGLEHFVCLWTKLSQFTFPQYPARFGGVESRKRRVSVASARVCADVTFDTCVLLRWHRSLLRRYGDLYNQLVAEFPSLRQGVNANIDGVAVGVCKDDVILLALFSPGVPSGKASTSVATLLKKLKKDAARFVIPQTATW